MSDNSNLGLVAGFGLGFCLGAVAMYYLDPDRGRRRRALVRDQAVHLTHETEDLINRKAQHYRNRATGIIAEARGAVESLIHTEGDNHKQGRLSRSATDA